MARRLDRAGGSLAHSCLPASAGGFPRDHLLSKGCMAEPQAGAVCGGRPSPLSTKSPQLQLGAPVQAVEDLGAQASLSKDSPQVPCLPKFLGCLGPPVRLQGREDSTPKLPIHAVSLAEGRGESPFLRFLHLDAWREKLSSGSLPRGTPGCPARPQTCQAFASAVPSAWKAIPQICGQDILSPPSLCFSFTSSWRPA